jgi:uncharacterized protein
MYEKTKDPNAIHGIIFTILLPVSALTPYLQKWPLFWLAPLSLYLISVLLSPRLRKTFDWLKFGTINLRLTVATLAIVVVTSVTLVMFQSLEKPDLDAYRKSMPFEVFGTIAATAILFPLINATLEELVYRGILFTGIESIWNTRFAAFTTSLLFGIGHLQGYPPGATGATLASIYGLLMAWLRIASKGLALPIAAHIFADATIYGILVWHEKAGPVSSS